MKENYDLENITGIARFINRFLHLTAPRFLALWENSCTFAIVKQQFN